MKSPITVPSIGESITEVTLSSIFKPTGTWVKEGEEIGELETDKVNQVLYAKNTGMLNWQAQVGQKFSIGQEMGYIDTAASPSAATPSASQPIKIAPKSPEPTSPAAIQEKSPSETPSRKPMSSLRQTLAKRLVEAKNSTAMLTTFNEVDMSGVMAVREKFKEPFLVEHKLKLGFMSFFIKASCEALKAFPEVGYQIEGTDFIKPSTVDIGIAVSTDKGLMVPVLRQTENKKFALLEKELAELAEKARNKTISLQELKGGCFSITNGGVFGSLLSTPILNLPQSAILGMHTIQKRAVVVDDQIVIRPMMYLALSYDHRVIDGKEAVQFLVMIKKILETNAEDLYLDRTF